MPPLRSELRILLLTVVLAASAAATPPRLFFSDLESGPATGGEQNLGAIITLYGNHFGPSGSPSSITLNGAPAARILLWTNSRIAFQPGPAASSGSILVTTPGGVSNPLPFTVRPGRIFFVSPHGRNSASGAFTSPWKSLTHARDAARPGDIIYALDGLSQPADDGQGWDASLLLRRGGRPGLPIALLAYPGATVTIGADSGPSNGIRTTDSSSGDGACPGHWILAGLTLRGRNAALSIAGPSEYWRIIANDISCPNGNGAAGCFGASRASHIRFLGNHVHHAGSPNASALYHGVYFSTDSNHLEIAYNTIAHIRGCRGLHIHSSPLFGGREKNDPTGHNMFAIDIHSNLIHHTQCDGIILATVDPSRGPIRLFNNVIHDAGAGPTPPEKSGNFSCLMIPATTNNGPPGGGVILIEHNTFHRCGAHPSPPWDRAASAISRGGDNPQLRLRLVNNLFSQPNPAPFLINFGDSPGIEGANNFFAGAPPPPGLLHSRSGNPGFLDEPAADLRLSPSSAARRTGAAPSILIDRDGVPRPPAQPPDAGAHQSLDSSLSTRNRAAWPIGLLY